MPGERSCLCNLHRQVCRCRRHAHCGRRHRALREHRRAGRFDFPGICLRVVIYPVRYRNQESTSTGVKKDQGVKHMNRTLERRSLLKTMALGLGTMALPSSFAKKKPAKKLKIGHTCITWGTFPRPGDDATLEPALKDISAEGFWTFETFPEVLANWDK